MNDFLFTLSLAKYILIIGPIIGGTCALLSVYVVLRKMALISEGVSHAGFGGIAVAVLLGYYIPALDQPPFGIFWREIITGLFCLITALLIGYVTRNKRVHEDSAIGIFLVATVAIGMLLLSIRRQLPSNGRPIPVDVETLLFGNLTNVNLADTLVAGGTALVVFSVIGALYYQFLYTTLDEEMARVNGVRTGLINMLLLVMISTVIVVSVRAVGFLMITALTIIPGATANMISRRFSGVLVASLLIGTLGTFAASCLCIVRPFTSYAPGPIIVLTLFLIFSVTWVIRRVFKTRPVPIAVEGATKTT